MRIKYQTYYKQIYKQLSLIESNSYSAATLICCIPVAKCYDLEISPKKIVGILKSAMISQWTGESIYNTIENYLYQQR